jgi:hypothetical protein
MRPSIIVDESHPSTVDSGNSPNKTVLWIENRLTDSDVVHRVTGASTALMVGATCTPLASRPFTSTGRTRTVTA